MMAEPLLLSTELMVLGLLCVCGLVFLSLVRAKSKHRATLALNARLLKEAEAARSALARSEKSQKALQDALLQATRDWHTTVANIHNELRMPLSALSAIFQRISQHDLGGESDKIVARGQNTADHAISKLDAHLLAIACQPSTKRARQQRSSIKELVQDWEQLLAERIARSRKDLTYSIQVAASTPKVVWVDEDQLNALVERIFENAVRYSTSGQITAKISSMPHDAEVLHVAFVDAGRALAPESTMALYERNGSIGSENPGVARRMELKALAPAAESLGGHLSIEKSDFFGTEVVLTLNGAKQLPATEPERDVFSAA